MMADRKMGRWLKCGNGPNVDDDTNGRCHRKNRANFSKRGGPKPQVLVPVKLGLHAAGNGGANHRCAWPWPGNFFHLGEEEESVAVEPRSGHLEWLSPVES